MAFDRNIKTEADVATPDSGVTESVPGPTVTADDYVTKLLKYVPAEIVGAYLFIASAVEGNVPAGRDKALWLLVILAGALALTILYNIHVLGVRRKGQHVMSVVGLTVYVFAFGGWFATTSWYEPWHSSIALALFALTVAMVKLRPLEASKA